MSQSARSCSDASLTPSETSSTLLSLVPPSRHLVSCRVDLQTGKTAVAIVRISDHYSRTETPANVLPPLDPSLPGCQGGISEAASMVQVQIHEMQQHRQLGRRTSQNRSVPLQFHFRLIFTADNRTDRVHSRRPPSLVNSFNTSTLSLPLTVTIPLSAVISGPLFIKRIQ